MVTQFNVSLATPLNQGDNSVTEIFTTSISTADGTTHVLTMSDFPFNVGYLVVDPTNSNFEVIKFTGIDSSGIGFTGINGNRGLPTYFSGGETSITANIKAHSVGAQVIITDNINWFMDHFTDLHTAQTVAGVKTFSSFPLSPNANPTTALQFSNKQYVDGAITGANSTASNTTAGTLKVDQVPNSLPRALNVYVQQQATPGMTLKVLPIHLNVNEKVIAAAGGNTGTVTAPVSNPRIDLIVIQSSDASIQVRGGSENASPVVPTPTSGDIVLAEVFNRVGETSLKDQDDSTNGYIQRWLTPTLYRTDLQPSGVMMMYAGSTAPTGWQLCDGSALSRTTQAALFAVISTTYGTGDGSTTFNVPDMRGRVPIGVGTGTGGGASGTGLPTGGSSLTARSRGDWLGEETHVLSVGELPAHTHAFTGARASGGGGTGGNLPNLSGTQDAITPTSVGSGTGHNNIQPEMAVNFIIKL